MTAGRWELDSRHGRLHLHTGVTGRARRFGHRLTIEMTSWRAQVDWSDDVPIAVTMTVDVDSLQILAGQGGATPLTAPEKVVARANALKSLGANRFPEIRFTADDIAPTTAGYRVAGLLDIHGQTVDHAADVEVSRRDDMWQLTTSTEVRQSEVGIKPFSMMLGALAVADVVCVDFAARHAAGA